MKIVNRETFLAMPAGTLFSKYQPNYFEPLCIKGETLPTNDFLVQQLHDAIACRGQDFGDVLDDAQETGDSLGMDFENEGRDGCFDGPEVLFAVWEQNDVRLLIGRLARALACSEPPWLPPEWPSK